DLIGPQHRNAGLVSFRQALTDTSDLFSDVIVSSRDQSSVTAINGSAIGGHSTALQYGGTLGLRHGFVSDWQIEPAVSYNRADSHFDNFGAEVTATPFHTNSTVWSADAKSDGTLFSIPGGPVKSALGVQYRKEIYDAVGDRLPTNGVLTRTVSAAF